VLAQGVRRLGRSRQVSKVGAVGGFFNVESSFDSLPQAMEKGVQFCGRNCSATRAVTPELRLAAHLPLNAWPRRGVFEIEVGRRSIAPLDGRASGSHHRGLHDSTNGVSKKRSARRGGNRGGF